MLRAFIAVVLVVGVLGCGNEDEVAELRAYTQKIKSLDDFNAKVEATITRFDDPTQAITRGDIITARKLIDDYAAAANAVPRPEDTMLGNTHDLFLRAFDEARRVAADETGDVKRQAHSVAIGLRSLRRDVEGRYYPTLEVLLERAKLTGDEYQLSWPKKD